MAAGSGLISAAAGTIALDLVGDSGRLDTGVRFKTGVFEITIGIGLGGIVGCTVDADDLGGETGRGLRSETENGSCMYDVIGGRESPLSRIRWHNSDF